MKKILFTIGVYFPYENGGGMATSVKNLLAKLKNEFEIYVLTKQQTKSEQNDKIAFVNTWLKIDQVFYYYASAKQLKTTNLRVLINKLSPSVIYCSSFFEPITIRINLLFRLKLIDSKKLVVAPRGELGAKALTKRRLKKQLYLNCYNAVQMFRTVHFHVTCESEQCSLKEAINAHPSFIHKISNYGSNPISYQKLRKRFINERKLRSGRLKIAFISRIEEQKNLLFAIKVVIKADIQVLFDIYGEINDLKYFEKCKKLMNSNNKIQIHYKKSLNSNQVRDTLLKYDLLFLPTYGENYCHVIAESLSVGTPVLISNNTPWLKLQDSSAGWVFSLRDKHNFTKVLQYLNSLKEIELKKYKISALKYYKSYYNKQNNFQQYLRMFN